MTGGDRFSDLLDARRKAMDYLARREYGRKELQLKLEQAGFAAEAAAEAINRLAAEGLQDDCRFAASFLQSRIDQGKGPVRIRLELEQRDIAAPLIGDALADTREDWFALASRVRQRKFGAAPPRDFREKARQMRFLQYRGFEAEQIQAAMADCAGDGGNPDDG